MDNNNANLFNPPNIIFNQQNNNHPQVANLYNKDNNFNQQNLNNNNEEDDELQLMKPKEDNPNYEQNRNEVYNTPGNNNLELELQNYYKELSKKDKQNLELEKIEKQKKELDLELNASYSFSFNQYTKPSLVVLENVGNSTYMSCVLQCLANIKSIAKYYLKELDTIKKKLIEMPLSYAFSRTIFHLYPYPQNTLQKSYYLSSFYKMTLLLNPFYQGKSTKNAVDFLVFLLDTLHNEDKTLPKYNNNNEKLENNRDFKEYIKYLSRNENSIIFTDFGWVSQKIRKCDMCNSEAINYRQFFTFDLDIDESLNKTILKNQRELSIYDCIKYQFVKDKKYNVYCKNCQKKTNFEEENLISVSPNYFIFILRIDKIMKKKENNKNIGMNIKVDEELNLNNLIKENFNNNSPNYTIVGMVIYDLRNDRDYKAYCLNVIDKNWYKYGKEKITKVEKTLNFNLDELIPVILFYKLKKETNN